MYVSYPVLDYVSLLLLSYPFRYVDPPALHYPGQSYRLCMACLTLSCLVWSCLALPHLALALGGIMVSYHGKPCYQATKLPSYQDTLLAPKLRNCQKATLARYKQQRMDIRNIGRFRWDMYILVGTF